MAMSTLGDDDDAENRRLQEAPDNLSLEEAKLRIIELVQEKDRKQDYQNRLEKKLQKLEGDLSRKRDDVESMQRTLVQLRDKDASGLESRRREHAIKTRAQEERIRDDLSTVLFTKPQSAKGQPAVFDLQTVIVTYVKPNDGIRYNLPFRVDSETTLKNLIDDACKYWDVSEHDYILKTMGNSKCQNEILVRDCFKQGEIAQLRLERKKKDNTEISEAERKAIQPKGKKGAARVGKTESRYSELGVDNVIQSSNKYFKNLNQMGGTYFLLKVRDHRPSEHAGKIKLRDVIAYLLLVAVTITMYVTLRIGSESYWYTKSIEDMFMVSTPKPDPAPSEAQFVPAFSNVSTHQDIWDWIEITLPEVIWPRNLNWSFDEFNTRPGYLSIRVKKVRTPNPAHQYCENLEALVNMLPEAACYPFLLDSDTEDRTDNEALMRVWEWAKNASALSDKIRGPRIINPGQWRDADYNYDFKDITSTWGNYQTYDGAGYSINYKVDYSTGQNASMDQRQFYHDDMVQCKRLDWIPVKTTRAVIIDVLVYNSQYDLWLVVQLLFEMPPSGKVNALMHMVPFKPNICETNTELIRTFYLDGLRVVIALYILVIVGGAEIHHKIKNRRAGMLYYCSLNGVCDVLIVACIIALCVIRRAYLCGKSTEEHLTLLDTSGYGFISYGSTALWYTTLLRLEGALFALTMVRMLSLLRLNRHVYVMWHIMSHALRNFLFVLCMFIPTMWGFVVAAHILWGHSHVEFSSKVASFTSMFYMLRGQLYIAEFLEWDVINAVIVYLLFYVVVSFFFMSTFAVVYIDAYYTIQLTSNQRGEPWDINGYVRWCLPGVILNIRDYVIQSVRKNADTR